MRRAPGLSSRALACVLAASSACGRVAFDPLTDAAADASDAAEPVCWDHWFSGNLTFTVRRVDELDVGTTNDASVSPDGRELFYAVNEDLYVATRPGTLGPWTPSRRIDELSTAAFEGRLSLAEDNTAVFLSERAGSQGQDLWFTTRNADGTFTPPTQTQVATLNTTSNEQNADISRDGTRLYYSRMPGNIFRSSRSGGAYGTPVPMPDLDPLSSAVDPTLSPDERVAVVGASSMMVFDLYYATRATAADTFGTKQLVPMVNTGMTEVDPELSPNGCELYFSRGTTELFVATLVPTT